MIRVCAINDKEILEKYLQEEPYAGAILAAIEEFGFDEKFQTVYLDSEKRNLDTTIADFKRHAKARFYQDNFVDSIDFDYLEIEVIEE